MIRDAINLETGRMVEIVEGIDQLCLACPFCDGEKSQSPAGDEVEVRKWDHLVLKGLDLKPGAVLSVTQLRDVFKAKSPIPFCSRCRYRCRE